MQDKKKNQAIMKYDEKTASFTENDPHSVAISFFFSIPKVCIDIPLVLILFLALEFCLEYCTFLHEMVSDHLSHKSPTIQLDLLLKQLYCLRQPQPNFLFTSISNVTRVLYMCGLRTFAWKGALQSK